MTDLKHAGIISLILNAVGAALNFFSYQSQKHLLIKLSTFGGEITIEHGFGGLQAVHIYAMTPDGVTTHSLRFSPVLFLFFFLASAAVIYVILRIVRRMRRA